MLLFPHYQAFCYLSVEFYQKFQFHTYPSLHPLQFFIPSHLIIQLFLQLVLLHLATKVVDKLAHKNRYSIPLLKISFNLLGCLEEKRNFAAVN